MRRWDIINTLIQRNQYTRYLEIGLARSRNFDRIQALSKTSVDPVVPKATYWMSSDVFFERNHETFDIIFIDGDHNCGQVLRDFSNALSRLSQNGTIVAHDCNPPNLEHESARLCGTVWRAWAHWRMTVPSLSMWVVDTDYGCGIIQRGSQQLFPKTEKLDYAFLDSHRKELLNLVPPGEKCTEAP